MAQVWHYQSGGRQCGPVSAAELKELVAAGRLRPDDLIWTDGMDKWVPARSVKGLFPTGAAKTAKAAPAPGQAVPTPARRGAIRDGDDSRGPRANSAAARPSGPAVEKRLSTAAKVVIFGGTGFGLLLVAGVLAVILAANRSGGGSGGTPTAGAAPGDPVGGPAATGPHRRPGEAANLPGASSAPDPRFAAVPRQDFGKLDYTRGPAGEELTVQEGEAGGQKRRASGFLRAGKFVPHGPTTISYPGGQKKNERYWYDGKRNGPVTFWHPNGKRMAEFTEADQKTADGLSVWWYESGLKKSEKAYKDGRGHGPEVLYWESGHVKREATFDRGRLDGLVVYYSSNGVKRRQEDWSGRQCKQFEWYDDAGRVVDEAPTALLTVDEFLDVLVKTPVMLWKEASAGGHPDGYQNATSVLHVAFNLPWASLVRVIGRPAADTCWNPENPRQCRRLEYACSDGKVVIDSTILHDSKGEYHHAAFSGERKVRIERVGRSAASGLTTGEFWQVIREVEEVDFPGQFHPTNPHHFVSAKTFEERLGRPNVDTHNGPDAGHRVLTFNCSDGPVVLRVSLGSGERLVIKRTN